MRTILAYFDSLLISIDIRRITGDSTAIYFWGSLQNHKLANQDSDIDLLVFTDQDHLNYVEELRVFQDKYHQNSDFKFDLSINDKADLISNKKYRFNRGVTITHELTYHYYPFNQVDFPIELSQKEILLDAYEANLINLNEAKKILLKTDLKSSRIIKIPKFLLFGAVYLLYFRDEKNIDWSRLLSYFTPEDYIYDILKRTIELKSNGFVGIDLLTLKEMVETLRKIHTEQENYLKAHKFLY